MGWRRQGSLVALRGPPAGAAPSRRCARNQKCAYCRRGVGSRRLLGSLSSPSVVTTNCGAMTQGGFMEDELLDHARRIAQSLAPGDLDETLSRITAAAVEVLPDVTMASMTIRHSDNRLETVAPTDDVLCDLDAKQYKLQQGPCYDAATDEAYAVSSHLATDARWPDY